MKVGSLYRHYKGGLYKVIALGTIEATLEPAVIYEAQYGDHSVWVRTLAHFTEEVEYQGKSIARFVEEIPT